LFESVQDLATIDMLLNGLQYLGSRDNYFTVYFKESVSRDYQKKELEKLDLL